MVAALTGVGNTFADVAVVYTDSAESLLSELLTIEALGSVDAVGLSSSAFKGRPWGGVIRSPGWPRLYGKGSRFGCWPNNGWLLL
jgi:hypothetical protein